MITKRSEFGQRTILPDGQILAREDTIIEEDGSELSRRFHRTVYDPGLADPQTVPAAIKILTDVLWTPDVIAARKAVLAQVTTFPGGDAPVQR
jgi:hypothetical protein